MRRRSRDLTKKMLSRSMSSLSGNLNGSFLIIFAKDERLPLSLVQDAIDLLSQKYHKLVD